MEPPISFFNWSLKKLLVAECDTFEKAKTKIIFWILIFSLVKGSIAITIAWQHHQYLQFERIAIVMGVYIFLFKLLLAGSKYQKVIAHIMVWMGLFLIWTNIYFYTRTINIVTTQFIFMLILCSFYLLTKPLAILYSVLSCLPVMLHIVFDQRLPFNDMAVPNELASPGYEIIVILNFATIVICHYLFRQAFITNIQEKENLNLKLQLAVKEANLAAESKSDFLSTMSHELRTPLNSVIGISELLLQHPHNPEQDENLRILKFSASNLHSLINDILDFNKMGSGKLEIEKISVDLNKLLSDVSSGLRFQATQKNLEFILDIDEEIEGRKIISDPVRISQVIYNLAGNAIKFTEKGSVTLSVKTVCIDDDQVSIRFSIADTGIGINTDKLGAIFEPFTQASSSTTRNFGGTGLGLAIVKRLLFLFDSSIQVESKPGRGSVFFFELTFPFDKVPNQASSGLPASYDLNGLKILVAEDNQMNRLLISKVFLNWNVELSFAVNGQEAIDKVGSGHFDLVLMDLHMPIVDGYEATRMIRAMSDPIKSSLPVIALTASVSGNLNEKITAVGMNDFILKPFKLNDLYIKLQEVETLNKKKLPVSRQLNEEPLF